MYCKYLLHPCPVSKTQDEIQSRGLVEVRTPEKINTEKEGQTRLERENEQIGGQQISKWLSNGQTVGKWANRG